MKAIVLTGWIGNVGAPGRNRTCDTLEEEWNPFLPSSPVYCTGYDEIDPLDALQGGQGVAVV
ncbi:MAG: hypothetical protein ACERKU_03130 [Nitrospirota bacterium]